MLIRQWVSCLGQNAVEHLIEIKLHVTVVEYFIRNHESILIPDREAVKWLYNREKNLNPDVTCEDLMMRCGRLLFL